MCPYDVPVGPPTKPVYLPPGGVILNDKTTRNTKWDKTSIITKILSDRKYEVMMDGSRRITMRNMRHLRRVPGNKAEL